MSSDLGQEIRNLAETLGVDIRDKSQIQICETLAKHLGMKLEDYSGNEICETLMEKLSQCICG